MISRRVCNSWLLLSFVATCLFLSQLKPGGGKGTKMLVETRLGIHAKSNPAPIVIPVTLYGPNNQIWMVRELICALKETAVMIMPPLFPHYLSIQRMGPVENLIFNSTFGILNAEDWLIFRQQNQNLVKFMEPSQGKLWWKRHGQGRKRPLRILCIGTFDQFTSRSAKRLMKWLKEVYQLDLFDLIAENQVDSVSCSGAHKKSWFHYDIVLSACFNYWIDYVQKREETVHCSQLELAKRLTQIDTRHLLQSVQPCLWRDPMQTECQSSLSSWKSILDKTLAVQIRAFDNNTKVLDKHPNPSTRDAGYIGAGKEGFPAMWMSIEDLAERLSTLIHASKSGLTHLFITTNLPDSIHRDLTQVLLHQYQITVLHLHHLHLPQLNKIKQMMIEMAVCVEAREFVGIQGSTFTENIFVWRNQVEKQFLL